MSLAKDASLLLREDSRLEDVVIGTVVVLAGATLEVDGVVTGDLHVEFGARAVVRGTVKGDIYNHGGRLELFGVTNRVTDASPGSVTIIDPFAVIRNPVS